MAEFWLFFWVFIILVPNKNLYLFFNKTKNPEKFNLLESLLVKHQYRL